MPKRRSPKRKSLKKKGFRPEPVRNAVEWVAKEEEANPEVEVQEEQNIVFQPNEGPQTDFLKLNETNATEDLNTVYNDTAPTSTVFTLGSNGDVNTNTRTQVAFVWAEVEGYSKFGTYTGNGNADGTFVYTGFRPTFVLFKRTDASGNSWGMKDTVRDSTNPNNGYLFAESSGAEGTATTLDIDFLSNGYKFRGTSSDGNASGGTYIYMAFAENPFKYANAG